LDGADPCTTACCNPDSDPAGDWCAVADATCQGANWGTCSQPDEGGDSNGDGDNDDEDNDNECTDLDNGSTDRDGDGCDLYSQNPHWCYGDYGDGDFESATMCCACGGGGTAAQTTTTTQPAEPPAITQPAEPSFQLEIEGGGGIVADGALSAYTKASGKLTCGPQQIAVNVFMVVASEPAQYSCAGNCENQNWLDTEKLFEAQCVQVTAMVDLETDPTSFFIQGLTR